MKNLFLLPLLALLFLASGCNDAADEFEQHLVGTWESMVFNEYLGLENVDEYTFHQNGTFERRHYYREEGDRQPVGFSAINRGDYSYNGSTLIYKITFTSFRPYEEPYVEENRLNVINQDVKHTSEITMVLQNNNREILFPSHIVGGDVIVPDMVYVRVD